MVFQYKLRVWRQKERNAEKEKNTLKTLAANINKQILGHTSDRRA